MGRVKNLAMEIRDHLGHNQINDQVTVEFELFTNEVLKNTSPCCESPLFIISYTVLECEKCKARFDRDVIFNRAKNRTDR